MDFNLRLNLRAAYYAANKGVDQVLNPRDIPHFHLPDPSLFIPSIPCLLPFRPLFTIRLSPVVKWLL